MEKVIIIGSGPAGYTAAIYTARAQLNPLLIAGPSLGGLAALASEVGNYPGFPEDITGAELMQRMQEQAERFGTRIEMDIVTGVDLSQRPFQVVTYGEEYQTEALIVTTGASPRKLGIPGEAEFSGRGVSYCATCDGFFYMDKELVMIGGGDSAVQEALFLTRFASKVTIVHRRNQFRAEKFLAEQALRHKKIEVIWDTVVTEITGNDVATGVRLQHVQTGEERLLPIGGVFVAVGYEPVTDFLGGQLALRPNGYIAVDEHGQTSVDGVWAAGDVCDWVYRQIAASVGTGCRVAIQAEQYIAHVEDRAYPGDIAVCETVTKAAKKRKTKKEN